MSHRTFDPPCACNPGRLRGMLRQRPEDFVVEELLGFTPEGDGEHLFLNIEKVGLNTQDVVRRLAAEAGVPQRQVSFSGLKDKHAITRQWFSLHLPGVPGRDWSNWRSPGLTVLEQTRHRKKLRRGSHWGNRFAIRVSQLQGDVDGLQALVSQLQQAGVPNYFGEQRFGHNGSNLQQARDWFGGTLRPKRHQRSMLLSAVRSWLFNRVLAQRVEQGSWSTLLDGELCMLDGSQSLFAWTWEEREALSARAAAGDLHPTGPLFGRPAKLQPTGQVAALEQRVAEEEAGLVQALQQHGLDARRRALRVIPRDFQWQLLDDVLALEFTLPGGCFATAVVRELVRYEIATTGAAN